MCSGYRQRGRGPALYHVRRHVGSGFTIIELIIIAAIVGIIVSLFVPAFGGHEEKRAAALRAAETFGFTNVQLNETSSGCASSNGCGDDDSYAFPATAVNQADKRVSFVICCGSGPSGCTVRTN